MAFFAENWLLEQVLVASSECIDKVSIKFLGEGARFATFLYNL
jgi:hypothetical protein